MVIAPLSPPSPDSVAPPPTPLRHMPRARCLALRSRTNWPRSVSRRLTAWRGRCKTRQLSSARCTRRARNASTSPHWPCSRRCWPRPNPKLLALSSPVVLLRSVDSRTIFQSLSNREPRPNQEQPDPTSDADITEFFADLQDVEAFDCYDFGEWVRIRLPRHGMLGFFSRQFAHFTTARLDQVAADAESDISEAKILDR